MSKEYKVGQLTTELLYEENQKLYNENINFKQALNEIREYCKKISNLFWVEDDEPKYVSKDILQIIDKVGGNEE